MTEAVVCLECPVGFYSPSSAKTMVLCKRCEDGSHSSRNGSSRCRTCDPGRYGFACVACSSGMYRGAQDTNASSCLTCAGGRFQDEIGQVSCADCLPGQFQSEQGSTDCISCHKGQFSNEMGRASPCVSCPTGYFQTEYRSSACRTCPGGRSGSASRGQSRCLCSLR